MENLVEIQMHKEDLSGVYLSNLSDVKLYQLCREYGEAALTARRKFLGLLPEVNRRELWKTHGFWSVFHFAAMLAGVSEEQVRRVLNIEKRLVKLPALHTALVSGGISVNKIAKVISIATLENQHQLANLSQNLSTRALETLVRDEKSVHVNTHLPQLFSESNSTEKLNLKIETEKRLSILQEKGIDIDRLIMEMLDNREEKIAEEKEEISAEYGSKCSVSKCMRESVTLHHTARFALTHSHDPHFLAPLCKMHHEIAHAVDCKVQASKSFANRRR